MANSGGPSVRKCLCHRLLRARHWQDRPQLEAVSQWWRGGGPGVCSLVGIGGAGKTAVADRFLQLLPGATEQAPGLAKDRSLPVPDGLFVFSFYDAPNPEVFFDELYDWLVRDFGVPERRRTTESGTRLQASASQVIDSLSNLRSQVGQASIVPDFRVLLVLDGMEKVQDDGSRSGVFGHVEDGGLRAFLLRAAAGWMPGVSTLVTTRLVPDDLEYERERNEGALYTPIDVEKISEEACIRLLRDRGVRGGDDALRRIGRECGQHALTVDLAATYLAHFCDGDPHASLEMPTAEELKELAAETGDRRLRYMAEQSARFANLARRYGEALRRSDRAALALLERICLFRLAVAADTLAAIFTGEGKQEISGPELAQLSRGDLDAKLALLGDIRLIERSDPASPSGPTEGDSPPITLRSPLFSVHPAVRDGFLSTLGNHCARSGHDAIRGHLMGMLGGLPGRRKGTPDLRTLDLLEEIVHHTLEAGYVSEAWNIYWCESDPCRVWESLGNFERDERICRSFLRRCSEGSAPLVPGLTLNCQAALIHTMGFCLGSLGRLSEAEPFWQRYIELGVRACRMPAIYNLAHHYMLRGLMGHAYSTICDGLLEAQGSGEARELRAFNALLAELNGLQGRTDVAIETFSNTMMQHITVSGPEDTFQCLIRLDFASLLSRVNRLEQAEAEVRQALAELSEAAHVEEGLSVVECHLALADIELRKGDITKARSLMQSAHDPLLRCDLKLPLCDCSLLRAQLELAEFEEYYGERDDFDRRIRSSDNGRVVACLRAIEEGLRIARECGYGIFHVDLLLERARLHLLSGDADAAQADARTALFDGHAPPPDSGLPTLLAATDPECGYAWGIAAGRHVLAEALLLQGAQILGRVDFTPARFHELPDDVQRLVNEAREQLSECSKLRQQIQDPKAAETERLQNALNGGVLTEYPLTVAPTPEPEPPRQDVAEASVPKPQAQGAAMQKVKILFLAANPSGSGQLALDQEAREIEAKIRAAEHRDSVELLTKWAVRPDDLLQYLNQYRPHVVHFSGHGSASDEIILNDDQGEPKPVSKAALQALFRTLKDNIRVVVLNACFSRPQARVIVGEIDCAIGMTKGIGDQAAIKFAASFYRAIGFGRSVQEAFEQGVAALLLEGIPEEKTPKLLVRDRVDASKVVLVSGE